MLPSGVQYEVYRVDPYQPDAKAFEKFTAILIALGSLRSHSSFDIVEAMSDAP